MHTGLPVVKGLAREQGDGIPDGMKVLLMDLPGMNPAQDVGIAEMTTAVGGQLHAMPHACSRAVAQQPTLPSCHEKPLDEWTNTWTFLLDVVCPVQTHIS